MRVRADWEIRIPEELEIATFDIHVILGNLFENAMNAMENMTEPSEPFPEKNAGLRVKIDRKRTAPLKQQQHTGAEHTALFCHLWRGSTVF